MISKIITLLPLLYNVYGKPVLLSNPDPYILQEYLNAITAYGPGLGVYSPYSYVDISYDNIPFVGKIPLFGKEGTSSKLGISPFYPPQGNPSNPFPPLYRARPLPLHVPEPQDVVAVPLDEEALHGEPLFPPELVLPGETSETVDEDNESENQKPENPFNDSESIPAGFVEWKDVNEATEIKQENQSKDKNGETIIMDTVAEKNAKPEDLKSITFGRDMSTPKIPFRSKRVK